MVIPFVDHHLRASHYTVDISLERISQMLKIDESGEFQLGFTNAMVKYKWIYFNVEKQSAYIESLLRIPLDPIYAVSRPDGSLKLIKGNARVETIRSFLDNEFPLKGLRFLSELNSKNFSGLDKQTQRELKRKALKFIIFNKSSGCEEGLFIKTMQESYTSNFTDD